MTWIKSSERMPKKGQCVLVPFRMGFRIGTFDPTHPFGPVVIDSETGRYTKGFTHWKPLNPPKA